GQRRRAHIAGQLSDCDVRPQRVQLLLLQVEVVEVAPSMRKAEACGGEVEGEVVVEVVTQVVRQPQPEVIPGRHGRSCGGRGNGEVPAHGGILDGSTVTCG